MRYSPLLGINALFLRCYFEYVPHGVGIYTNRGLRLEIFDLRRRTTINPSDPKVAYLPT